VQVTDPGASDFIVGDHVERRDVMRMNRRFEAEGKAPIRYDHVLMGITKSALNTESFISAASFQETTRVITEAALAGKEDWLTGLKENVILGRLLPAGTGLAKRRRAEEVAAAGESDVEPDDGEEPLEEALSDGNAQELAAEDGTMAERANAEDGAE